MKLKKIDNIIFLKNIESNIIEEALIILKDNVKPNQIKLQENIKNKKEELNIIKEAELIVNQKIETANVQYEKLKVKVLKKKYKILKIINIILICTIIISHII